jgi:TonB-linked SusC/RagA family outer membrane protein
MIKSLLRLALMLGLFPSATNAQSPPLKSALHSLFGNPVQGADIRLLASGKHTLSADNGSFTLQLSHFPDTLLITHIGYAEKKLLLLSPASLPGDIILEPLADSLAEVVVNTGYQQLPKERATGSFAFVGRSRLNEQVSTNILDRLETIANGYTLSRESGTKPQMMIRGLSTIQGVKDPLVVVDNFPYNGGLDNINPNDVESITLLKDAAAASIWGAQAANGVIVITTRKARFNQPLKIEFSSNLTTGRPTDIMSYRRISPSDYVDVEQLLFDNKYRFSDTSASARPPFSPVYEILFRQRRGELSSAQAQSLLDRYRAHDVRQDFLDHLYRNPMNQQYALNLSGGGEGFHWMLSGGHDRNTSEHADTYRRTTLRSDNTLRLGKRLTLTTSLNYVFSSTRTGRPGLSDITTIRGQLPPYTFLFDDNGAALPIAKDLRQSYTDSAGAGKLLNWNYYADDYTHVNNTTDVTGLLTNTGLSWQAGHGFTLELRHQYERQQTDNRLLQDADSYFARDLVNRYSQLNRSTGQVTYRVPPGGVLSNTHAVMDAHSARLQVSYNGNLGADHRLNALAGAEIRDVRNHSNAYRIYGYDDHILTNAVVDYADRFPSFINGATSLIPMGTTQNETDNRFVSVFANAAYSWKERYGLSASMRRDASNNFGVATNDRWTPLWSMGASWDLNREGFSWLRAFSLFKLRVTYGMSGNVDISKSAVTTISYQGTSAYTLTPYSTVDRFYNPDLRWEKTAMWNMGLDFRLKNGVLSGSLEYYRKNGTDLYGASLLDYTAGLGTQFIIRNVASMKAQGIDLELHTVNLSGLLRWESDWIINYAANKVLDYYLPSLQASQYAGGFFTPIAGGPVNGLYLYRWAGLDPATGDPKGYLGGQVSKNYASITSSGSQVADLALIGNRLPTVTASFGNTLRWKSWSLSVRLMGKFGNYFLRRSINYSNLFSNGMGDPDYALRWQHPGDEQFTQVPSMVYPAVSSRDAFYNNSEVLAEKADFIRLQYVSLQYRLVPRSRQLPFDDLTMYAVMNNLGLVWRANHKGLDPGYPGEWVSPPMTVSLGIRLHF